MAIFRPKPWKMSVFRRFVVLFFYSLERRFFVLEYRKEHFPMLYYLKKKSGKMAIFGPISWVNPFGKISIFRRFELVIFISQKGVFSFQNIVKDIFLAYIVPKKKYGKMATSGPKAWFYPFGKMSIFMGLTDGFGPKMGLFRPFFFRQYSIGKCPLRYSRTKKHLLRL